MLSYTTPSTGIHASGRGHRSDGATAKIGGSPASQPGNFNHYTTTFNDSDAGFSRNNIQVRQQPTTPYYMRILPDWDNRQIIPKPADSFVKRY